MGAQVHAAVQPAQIIPAPEGFTLYYRLAVTNAAATVTSLLPNGVLPKIPPPMLGGFPSGTRYALKGVVLQSVVDPATTLIRYRDVSGVPTITLGFAIPGQPNQVRIMADPDNIRVIGAVAGPTYVQCCLVIGGITDGPN